MLVSDSCQDPHRVGQVEPREWEASAHEVWDKQRPLRPTIVFLRMMMLCSEPLIAAIVEGTADMRSKIGKEPPGRDLKAIAKKISSESENRETAVSS